MILDAIHEITECFSRNFKKKQDLVKPINPTNKSKGYQLDSKAETQVNFTLKMAINECNTKLIRNNSTILEIQKDLEETTQMVQDSMRHVDERGSMLLEVEEQYIFLFFLYSF